MDTQSKVFYTYLLCLLLSAAVTKVKTQNSEDVVDDGSKSNIKSAAGLSCLNQTETVGAPVVPCSPHGCHQRLDESTVSNDDPCFVGNHETVDGEIYSAYQLSSSTPNSLPADKWLLFKGRDGECQGIIEYNRNLSDTCVGPGYCDGSFPWYLQIDDEKPKIFGSEKNFSMCMTDSTSRGTAICCQQSVSITMRSCGYYTLYKLRGTIPASIRGGICTAPKEVVEGKLGKTFGGMIRNGYPVPKRVDQLSQEMKENLVTTRFGVFARSRVDIWKVIQKYSTDLTNGLNTYYKRRAKRWGEGNTTPTLAAVNVKNVVGSPVIGENVIHFTFYIERDDGSILPQSTIIKSSKYLSNTELSHLYVYINDTKPGLDPNVHYPEKIYSTSTIPEPDSVNRQTPPTNTNWKIIIYIINVTCGIVLAVLIGLALYRWKLRKALRHDANKRLSKLDRMLLCENSSVISSECESSLKSSDSHVLQLAPSNGFIRISNGLGGSSRQLLTID